MGIFDFLFNREKNHFKQTNNKDEENRLLQNESITDTEEFKDNYRLVEISKRYTKIKKELLEEGINIDAEADPYKATLLINDFIQATLEQIPASTIIPINIPFEKDGIPQTLILGKDMISSSQFVKKVGNKPKHGILKHNRIALMIDKNKAPNIFNPGITNRVTINDDHSIYLINLLTDDFLESQTQSCRFSNIEFNFENWENSLEQIRNIGQTPYSIEMLKMLPTIDKEITKEITDFLEERTKDMEEQLNIVFENIEKEN